MISLVLSCVLWAKPEVKLIDVPVNEYGVAALVTDFSDFTFEGNVVEESMNSLRLSYRDPVTGNPTAAAETFSNDASNKALAIRLLVSNQEEASLDCKIKSTSLN